MPSWAFFEILKFVPDKVYVALRILDQMIDFVVESERAEVFLQALKRLKVRAAGL